MEKVSGRKTSSAFLFSAERYDHTDVESDVHMHPEMQIILVTDGVLNMTIDGKNYEITKGFGAFVPAFSPHRFFRRQPNFTLAMMFSTDLTPAFSAYLQEHVPTCHIFAPSAISMALVDSILPNPRNHVDFITAEAVLAPLCRDIFGSAAFEKRRQSAEDCTLRILEYVNAHFREELSLETVARAVGVHPVTVSKLFSRQTGVSFGYHLQYQRCRYAAKLLRAGKQSVSEIALEAGFGSTRSFHRAFRAIFGRTPTQYRQEPH